MAQAGRTTASLSANLARAPPRGRGRPSSARTISPKYLTWRHNQRKSFERFRSCWSTPRSKTLANPREETRCPAKIRREAFRRCRRSQPAVLKAPSRPPPSQAAAGTGHRAPGPGRAVSAQPRFQSRNGPEICPVLGFACAGFCADAVPALPLLHCRKSLCP